jgi:polysaccharide biosynthesis transport protein
MKFLHTPTEEVSGLPVRGEAKAAPSPHVGFELIPARGNYAGGASDLRRILLILRNRWRLIVLIAAGVVAASAIGTFLQTPIYRATGMIELRGKSADVVPVEAIFQSERLTSQYLETQYGVLRSPALARLVIAAVGGPLIEELGGSAAATSATTVVDSGAVDGGLAEAFANRLIVDPVAGSNLVKVHYESSEPQLAALVVNAVFENYASMLARAGHTAVLRLAVQVDSVRNQLAIAEQQLQLFARKNGLDVMIADSEAPGSIPNARLRALQEQYTTAEAERFGRQSDHSVARAEADALDSEVLRALSVRQATLRGEYAKLLATFSENYPRAREVKLQLDEQEALLARERSRIRGEIAGRYAAAVRRQNLLQAAIDSQRALVDRQSEKATQFGILKRDVEAQRQLYGLLQQKLRGAQVSSAVALSEVSVVGKVTAPSAPIRPVARRNLTLALVVGLVLGLCAAFAKEYTDQTIKTIEEVDSLPVPLLGVIPSIPRPAPRPAERFALGGSRQRNGVERPLPDRVSQRVLMSLEDAFASLRTSILINSSERGGVRSLLITSAQPNEGKTTVSINLALSMARLGRRVLLIDADTRRPSIHRVFGITAGAGLTDALGSETPWTSLVHGNVAPGLDVLPAGRPVGSPTELLASPRMSALTEEAEAAYDFIVIDSPALLINAGDTRILAPLVGGVLMVMRSGVTPRAVVGRLLRQVPNLAGVVLNELDVRDFPADYHAFDKPSDLIASTQETG